MLNTRVIARSYPLHIHMTLLFSTLVIATGIVLAWLGYAGSAAVAHSASETLFLGVARETGDILQNTLAPGGRFVDVLAHHPVTEARTFEERMRALPVLRLAFDEDSAAAAVYVGYANGSFFLLRPLLDDAARKLFAAPEQAAWLVDAVDVDGDLRAARLVFFDSDLREIARRADPRNRFDPRIRPWYREAIGSEGRILTAPYAFFSTRSPGFTVARRAGQGSVVGLDVTLQEVAALLAQVRPVPGARSVLFDAEGRVLATSQENEGVVREEGAELALARTAALSSPALATLAPVAVDGSAPPASSIEVEGREWKRVVMPVATPRGMLSLGIAIPLDELLADARAIRDRGLLAAFAVLLVALPLTYVMARGVARSLHRLAAQADDIRAFRFDGPSAGGSPVLEVDRLSDAMDRMRDTIRRFLDIATSLNAERRFPALLDRVARETAKTVGAEGVAIYLLAADGSNLICASSSAADDHSHGTELRVDMNEASPLVEAYRSRRTVVTPDAPPSLAGALDSSERPPVRTTSSLQEATSSTQEPSSSAQEPTSSTQELTASTQEPTASAQEPTASTQDPTVFTQEPTLSMQDRPASFDQRSATAPSTVLAIPLLNREGEALGVLALALPGAAEPPRARLAFAEALSATAAVAIETQRLLEGRKALLDALIRLVAGAIDAKSPYTGGHCQRVPELTFMLARAACEAKEGPLADFTLSEEEWEALHIASWLHDCGKVTTPEYVVDKATKLETLYDRIHEVRMRFEVLKRDAEIACWKRIASGEPHDACLEHLASEHARLDEAFAFVAECNIGGESLDAAKIERLHEIAAWTWTRTLDDRIGIAHEERRRKERTPAPALPVIEPLLADKPEHVVERGPGDLLPEDNAWGFRMQVPALMYNRGELANLCIARGTLTEEERYVINHHIVQTIVMLSQLPFPKHLRDVPEIAGGHHEKMDGTGYPKRLRREDMSWTARMMAIADIFEALTAVDRPYKKGKTLSEALAIMARMAREQHIDADLFALFVSAGVYRQYAERFLQAEQIDSVDPREVIARLDLAQR